MSDAVATSFVINKFELPKSYVAFLRSGKYDRDFWWQLDKDRWHSIFPEDEIEDPFLFSAETMIRLNENEWTSEEWAKQTKGLYFGKRDGSSFPGFLSPQESVLIGETGTDGPIALDFSHAPNHPSISYLSWATPGSPQWRLVAPNVDTLLLSLGISDGE